MLGDISEKPGHFCVQKGIYGIQIVVPREPHDQNIPVFLERDQFVLPFPHEDFSSGWSRVWSQDSAIEPRRLAHAPLTEHRWPRQAPRTGRRERVSMNPRRRTW